jgi:putative ABC transport system permease protein
MFIRFVAESLRRSPRRKAMTVLAIAMGTAIATAMLGVVLDIGDKINLELQSLGANILITPKPAPNNARAFLPESQIPKIKSIFWQLNLTGFMPSLTETAQVSGVPVPVRGVWFNREYRTPDGRVLRTGAQAVNPSWRISGRTVSKPNEALAGITLATRLNLKQGSQLTLFGEPFLVTGILKTGADEDDQILTELATLQRLTGHVGDVDSVQVAALTKPEDEFARKDPARMNPQELERWSCTNYVRSITHQIEGVLPMANARPVWRVAESEGRVLSKISGLMLLIALAALAAAALTVWSVMATTMLERRGEIAIMQATGGTDRMIASLFAAEIVILGLLGGAIGVLAGLQMAHWVGNTVFRTGIQIPAVLAPLSIFLAMVIALAGAFPPLRKSLLREPAIALRERL